MIKKQAEDSWPR